MISLPRDDKAWLDATAARKGVSMTEVVRSAVQRLRRVEGGGADDFDALLHRTRGCWGRGDALAYQRRIRSEWPGARSRT